MKPGRTVFIATVLGFLIFLFQPALGASMPFAIEDPEIVALNPQTIEAFTPLRLIISGRNFDAGSRVYIQTSKANRFISYKPVTIESEKIVVVLKIGFGLNPKHRAVYVASSDGSSSNQLQLDIVTKGSLNVDTDQNQNQDASENDQSTIPSAPLSSPTIHELQPNQALTAHKVNMLIVGEHFMDGAQVYVLANSNAGTAKAPEYIFLPFEAERLAETLLQVNFDRGFYSTPEIREIYVVNPDGGRSNSLPFTILSPLER